MFQDSWLSHRAMRRDETVLLCRTAGRAPQGSAGGSHSRHPGPVWKPRSASYVASCQAEVHGGPHGQSRCGSRWRREYGSDHRPAFPRVPDDQVTCRDIAPPAASASSASAHDRALAPCSAATTGLAVEAVRARRTPCPSRHIPQGGPYHRSHPRRCLLARTRKRSHPRCCLRSVAARASCKLPWRTGRALFACIAEGSTP